MERYEIQSAVYIGDTQGDKDAAVVAGMPFVFAAYGFGVPDGWISKIERFEDLLTL